jgi:hypothetical protein
VCIVFGNEPLQGVGRDTGRNEVVVRGEYAASRRFRSPGSKLVCSAVYDSCMHKVPGNEFIAAAELDLCRNETLVPSEDAALSANE